MSRKTENTGFICTNCGSEIPPLTNGSYRNHCNNCLYSLHVDNVPGDRASNCLGLLYPVGIKYNGKKGYQIIHRCKKCGAEKTNRTAPDDMDAVIALMRRGFIGL